MENKVLLGVSLVLCSNLVAAVSQILLKKAAGKAYGVWWRAYLNPLVMTAYALFFGTTVFSVFALRCISLSLCAALGASGQIFVPLLSALFLKEKLDRQKLQGMALIVLGIIIFSL